MTVHVEPERAPAPGLRSRSAQRVVVVGGELGFVERLHDFCAQRWPALELVHVEGFEAARRCLEEAEAMAVCAHLDPPYGRALAELKRLRAAARSRPVLAFGSAREPAFENVARHSGADAWLSDLDFDALQMEQHLTFALALAPLPARRCGPPLLSRAQLLSNEPQQVDCQPAPTAPIDPPMTVGEDVDAQAETAADVQSQNQAGEQGASCTPSPGNARGRRLLLIPIRPDGGPDLEGLLRAEEFERGEARLQVRLGRPGPDHGTQAIAAIEIDEARNEFAWVEIEAHPDQGHWRTRTLGPLEAFLEPSRLEPVLDPATLRYRYGLPLELIEQWCAAGVLVPELVDRIVVCPRCDALPTIRLGCRQCGSARLDNERLVHHFACANVARESEFATPQGQTCTKCRATDLVINSDYEILTGPWTCLDCGHAGGERDPVCHCLACGERFFAADGCERELVTFHAARMEPLAFLAAP